MRSRGPCCRSGFGVSNPPLLRADAWRSRGCRSMRPNAMLCDRRSVDDRTIWISTGAAGPWQVCLGEGITLEAYIRGVDARLGLEEESDAPFSVVLCGDHQSCVIAPLLMNDPESTCETRRHVRSTRACGAPRTSRRRVPSSACRRGGGEANAEARRASWLWGSGAVSGYVSVAPCRAAALAATAPTRGTCGGAPEDCAS